jgi:hypothetical protein
MKQYLKIDEWNIVEESFCIDNNEITSFKSIDPS